MFWIWKKKNPYSSLTVNERILLMSDIPKSHVLRSFLSYSLIGKSTFPLHNLGSTYYVYMYVKSQIHFYGISLSPSFINIWERIKINIKKRRIFELLRDSLLKIG